MTATQPTFGAASFACPHCGAIAHQDWFDLRAGARARLNTKDLIPHFNEIVTRSEEAYPAIFPLPQIGPAGGSPEFKMQVTGALFSVCFSCKGVAMWASRKLVWPSSKRTHVPNTGLPADIKRDFVEADTIHARSPRGAAALLRLALQKLCDEVEPGSKDLNEAIGRMVKKGLSPQVQQALDVVRVIGNNAVHPGTMDLKDDAATVSRLFELTNLIADATITQPRRIAEMYANLPQGAQEGIAQRDGKKSS